MKQHIWQSQPIFSGDDLISASSLIAAEKKLSYKPVLLILVQHELGQVLVLDEEKKDRLTVPSHPPQPILALGSQITRRLAGWVFYSQYPCWMLSALTQCSSRAQGFCFIL